jgi:hypothetical protein
MDVLMDMGLSPKVFKDDCFSPSAPKPYYRITKKEEG